MRIPIVGPVPFPINQPFIKTARSVIRKVQQQRWPINSTMRHTLVLTWACDPEPLAAQLPKGLELDPYLAADGSKYGLMVANIADVSALSVPGIPQLKALQQVELSYRIAVRHGDEPGHFVWRTLSSNRAAVMGARLALGQQQEHAEVSVTANGAQLRVRAVSESGDADLDLVAHLDRHQLPDDTVFTNVSDARRRGAPSRRLFSVDAGELVDLEAESASWTPSPVEVDLSTATLPAAHDGKLSAAVHLANTKIVWNPNRLFNR